MKEIVIKDAVTPTELMSTMGCRTQNGADINAPKSFEKNVQAVLHDQPLYDNFLSAAQKDGRGNICPVTIILPSIAMKAKSKCKPDEDLIDAFMRELDSAIYDAKDMLLERFEYICSQSPESAKFMYENNTMAGYIPEQGIRSALAHGTLAVGTKCCCLR